jgi:hypothetical protein
MSADGLQLFALSETRNFGEKVAAALGAPLGEHDERDFERLVQPIVATLSTASEPVRKLESV